MENQQENESCNTVGDVYTEELAELFRQQGKSIVYIVIWLLWLFDHVYYLQL